MTPPKKPEWMEIADGDNQRPVTITKKRRPAILAIAALLVTLGGVVAAQTHEESPASADELVTPQSATSAGSKSATAVAPAINPTPQSAPAIATPPNTTGRDGKEFGEHDGRGEHGRDGDFGRDHEGGRDGGFGRDHEFEEH